MEFTEKTRFIGFSDPGGGQIYVVNRCPECCRFVKVGKLFTDDEGGRVTFKKWTCKKHGDIEPFWTRD